LRNALGAKKAFYYDCINDVQLNTEETTTFEARVKAQEDDIDRIRCIPGYHVRLGSLSGKHKKIRQKQVDVLLAVEAMHHAFQKNMSHAVLIAGDLDFKPIVDSLIQYGIYVTVRYDRSSASSHFFWAADSSQAISPIDYWCWSPSELMSRYRGQFPQHENYASHPPMQAGQIPVPGGLVQIYGTDQVGFSAVDISGQDRFGSANMIIRCPSRTTLEKYIREMYCP
jgi:uncharacterized LabA/DUF88 family protein